MKTGVKIAIAVAAVLGVAAWYAKDKIETAIEVFQNVSIKPFSLPKNIRFSNPNSLNIPQNVNFNIDIAIVNPDFRDFSASGFGVIKLASVSAYFQNALIGVANLNLEEIIVPAQSQFILQNVAMTGNTLSILQNIAAFSNIKLSDLKFTAIIEDVLGNQYEIGS